MTGEITLTGRVLPIGGLREKSTAAYAKGIRTLLIPKDNMRDIAELDTTVASEVTFIPCENLNDVLSRALRHRKSDHEIPALPGITAEENSAADEVSHLPGVICPAGNERTYGSL